MITDERIKELVKNAMYGAAHCADVSLYECIEFAIRKGIEESSDLAVRPLLPGTPRTDSAIKEATDSSRPDLLHYMNMTGVLNQLCRELEMELNAAIAARPEGGTTVEVMGHPDQPVSARCILSGCRDFDRLTVYHPCAKHMGMSWTMTVGVGGAYKQVCPICQPPMNIGPT